ncbi:hypothetical protein PV682_26825 [Streptomyces niveiscabiei]|uniref:hypothetical protein n=1 Tax=Streptomyces niveiscabiei TaxID=164115 RepID=UPI0029B78561|nr:hypothetical protein [Streptomyces niveiscabiei]MDX3385063.1 hypothetical protein [Streptomyces niveiscabiei]
MNTRTRLTTAGLAALLSVGGLGLALAPSASAEGACTEWRSIQVSHNAVGLKYRECDRYSGSNTQTKAQLYLWDNKHDGKIAQAYTATGSNVNGSWRQSWERYYGWGDESKHSPLIDTGWHKGHDVRVLLKATAG